MTSSSRNLVPFSTIFLPLFVGINIAKEDTYALGDGVNDLEMLGFVGHGIAMGNASQVAKDAAEYVTSHIHEDGVFHALKYYGLI